MEPHRPLITLNQYCRLPREALGYFDSREDRKCIIRKYYGRKILVVEKPTHFTAAVNRSKYFLHFEVYEKAIPAYSFDSLANLIIFNTDIILRYHCRGRWHLRHACFPNIHPLQLKKALRYCKSPQAFSPQLKHLQHLFHLKSLTLHVINGSSMSKASKIIRKLRSLQSLHLKYLSDYDESDPNLPIKLKGEFLLSDPDDQKGWGFFHKISKLPRLQRFSLQTSLRTLEGQSSVVQQDFADFYLRSHRFKIETEMYGQKSLDIQELTAKNLESVLKTADSLSLYLGVSKTAKKNPYICKDKQSDGISEQESRKILKQGERPVKLYVLYKEKLQVNIGCLLTRCDKLVSLYLKASGTEVRWDQDYGNLSNKLQTVVLDLDSFGLKYEVLDDRRPPSGFQIEEEVYEVSGQRKVKFHSGLVQLLKQLKTRAPGLETLTLFICLVNFEKSWLQPKSFKELYEKVSEEKAKEFFEELESFEKFHRLGLCKKPGYLDQWISRILTAKSLKIVHTRSCSDN